MYGLTRGPVTLIAAAAAGLLIWLATQLNNGHQAGYWGIIGLMAAAGLIMAWSQILGGWTKWGWPRLSATVFLVAFIPVAVAALWVILAGEPNGGWFHNHVMSWTRDLHISGLVTDLLHYIPVLAFGAGLVFGFSFDTTGPRARDVVVDRTVDRRRDVVTRDQHAADEPLTAERDAASQARPTTTTVGPADDREAVATDGRAVDDTSSTRTTDRL
jgi:hypothetical protein